MTINLPIYQEIGINDYQMFPGQEDKPGLCHTFSQGLHLVAGVNGLGKSTFLLALYHGVVGAAHISNDNYGTPKPVIVQNYFSNRFRKRVSDNARSSSLKLKFSIGEEVFEISRSLYDLSIKKWSLDGSCQPNEEANYQNAVSKAMRVDGFADVLILLNLLVFMFEERSLLMWTPLAQRNVLRILFMSPEKAGELADRAQKAASCDSAYRNLLHIVNRDRKKLYREKEKLENADSLSEKFYALQRQLEEQKERLKGLYEYLNEADEARQRSRITLERAKSSYDELVRELEALKLARVAKTFPSVTASGRYVIDRLISDEMCLVCGANDGPLVEIWISKINHGNCLVCGALPETQESLIPSTTVDARRISRLESKLNDANHTKEEANHEFKESESHYHASQAGIDQLLVEISPIEKRMIKIGGSLPPTPRELQQLEERVTSQEQTLQELKIEQEEAERAFSLVFDEYQKPIKASADKIRERFAARISEFLLERAEISYATIRDYIGKSGKRYEWPSFELSMTSGTFDNPSPRQSQKEVSMSQGEFIDLAFRLALVDVAAGDGPATLIFDAPEASLDALFMRRAGAFLANFTQNHAENRLIVTSNLTNADMIPALFGAYNKMLGDPDPVTIPRIERSSRVIDLLKIAAPTTAVQKIGSRYDNLLDIALFPPKGEENPGL